MKKPTMPELIGSIIAWVVVSLVLAYAVSIFGFRVVSVFILVIFVAPVLRRRDRQVAPSPPAEHHHRDVGPVDRLGLDHHVPAWDGDADGRGLTMRKALALPIW